MAPKLGEAPYFNIPPLATREDLEARLEETGLKEDKGVQLALDSASKVHRRKIRDSSVPALEEHSYPTSLVSIDYQKHEMLKGNVRFSKIHPEGPIIALLHDVPDDRYVPKSKIIRMFGENIAELLWPLTDKHYLVRGASSYDQKIEMKFKALEKSLWPTQVVGLADRLTNSLCYYTPPYINQFTEEPTQKMKRQIARDKIYVLPFAKKMSPDFFFPMFSELMNHYKLRYPQLFEENNI